MNDHIDEINDRLQEAAIEDAAILCEYPRSSQDDPYGICQDGYCDPDRLEFAIKNDPKVLAEIQEEARRFAAENSIRDDDFDEYELRLEDFC